MTGKKGEEGKGGEGRIFLNLPVPSPTCVSVNSIVNIQTSVTPTPSHSNEMEEDDNENLILLADAAIADMGISESHTLKEVSTDTLIPLVAEFQGGNIKNFASNWEKLTSDKNIISIVKYGLTIRFRELPSPSRPFQMECSEAEKPIVQSEIQKLLHKRVIHSSDCTPNDFFSPVFLRDKQDGTQKRVILNLKRFNDYLDKIHFKMESISQIISMIQPGCWMASFDLKDAYYSVSVHPKHRHYFKFLWNEAYEYDAMPMGYRDAPRIFTKLLKPVFATLRERGHQSVIYLDDGFLQGLTYNQCKLNIMITIRVLIALGFTIHPVKSIFDPVQEITTLGFIINSVTMIIALTPKKRKKLKRLCIQCLSSPTQTIRKVAQLVGNLVAATQGVPLAPLYYRRLEKEKATALKKVRGNYDAKIQPSTMVDIKH